MINSTGSVIPDRSVFDPIALVRGGNQEDNAEQPPQLPQSLQPFCPTDPLAGIQSQFASLLQGLTQQLTALENQLMQALRQITGGAQPPSSQEDDPNKPVAGRGPMQPFPPEPLPQQPSPHHPFQKIVCDAAQRHEVDPLLVNAVIRQESGFQANAVSKTGARGLMQLMPDTARSLGVNDAFNPRQNVEGGTTLLRQLIDRYHGQLDLALAAYNAGPAAVDKYGGVPPFPETQAYVKNVLASYKEGALSASPA